MAGIFISYRRDDASGHAGRLFDRLAARFGREHVFMDVTDIAPGDDFTQVIEASVGTADLLLAVIGPQWLSAAEPGGARRIDDAMDFVRQEIAAAFQRKVRVIPVLVRGARMPRSDDLPDALKELARRQAVELTDARWDSDLSLFEQALSERLPASGARSVKDTTRKPGRTLLYAALAVMVLLATVMFFRQDRTPAGQKAPSGLASAARTEKTDAVKTREPDPGKLVAGKTVYHSLSLPKVSRFKLRGQQFEFLGLRTETVDVDKDLLTVLLRMTNNGAYAATFTDLGALLEYGGESIAPASPIFQLIPANAAAEGELQFPVARSAEQVALSLRYGDEETRIPFSIRREKAFTPGGRIDAYGGARLPQLVDVVGSFPVDIALPSPNAATLGAGKFSINAIRLDRYNAERAVLEVQLQASAAREAAGGINFWSDNLRLIVDDVPRAPINSINELVAAGTTKTAKFEFLLTDRPKRLELMLRSGPWESGRMPLVLPGKK
jgi:hypothetical protein